MAEDRKVSLGCGTLILIALIVLIFGNANRSNDFADVERELQKLQSEISQLHRAVDQQTERISLLELAIESQR